MRSTPPGLAEYLDILERFLEHCQRHLQPEDWEILARRLSGTPPGYSVQGAWRASDYVVYYWRKLTPAERRAFLRAHRRWRWQRQEVL